MNKYKVALLGLGARGQIHARGFLDHSDRFELSAICDLNWERLEEARRKFDIAHVYTNAETMLEEIQPDIFCFATLPDLRVAMVELAVRCKVKAVAFEKPMATSLREARTIADLCERNGMKAIVSHQQKYLTSMQRLKRIIDSGEIGDIVKMHATTLPWASQLGTHFIDYMIWANGGSRAQWVVGHIHGKQKLADSHPSPDYLFGQILFANNVRGIIECGYLSPVVVKGEEKFWVNNRLTVYGSHGYAWAETDGRWGGITRSSGGEPLGGQDDPWTRQSDVIQGPYLRDFADWLDDENKQHSCSVDIAYHGYEILEGVIVSALDKQRIDLPLREGEAANSNERMARELADAKAPIRTMGGSIG